MSLLQSITDIIKGQEDNETKELFLMGLFETSYIKMLEMTLEVLNAQDSFFAKKLTKEKLQSIEHLYEKMLNAYFPETKSGSYALISDVLIFSKTVVPDLLTFFNLKYRHIPGLYRDMQKKRLDYWRTESPAYLTEVLKIKKQIRSFINNYFEDKKPQIKQLTLF